MKRRVKGGLMMLVAVATFVGVALLIGRSDRDEGRRQPEWPQGPQGAGNAPMAQPGEQETARPPGNGELEEVCRVLKAQAGGEWEPGLHNSFSPSVEEVVRGRLRDASGKTLATYLVLPIGAGVDPYAQKALGLYGKAHGRVSILGLGPRFTVVEVLRAGDDEAVKQARSALVKTLELSPPRITVDMYRPVLSAAERALERAQAQSLPDIAPARRRSIAGGQTPFIEERDGTLRFVWEVITSSKTGYRVAVEQARDGKVSVLEVKLGL